LLLLVAGPRGRRVIQTAAAGLVGGEAPDEAFGNALKARLSSALVGG